MNCRYTCIKSFLEKKKKSYSAAFNIKKKLAKIMNENLNFTLFMFIAYRFMLLHVSIPLLRQNTVAPRRDWFSGSLEKTYRTCWAA